MSRLRLGISACLLGEQVRFNGGHARAPHVLNLSEHVQWVPVCPEMEIGLGAPRPTIRIAAGDGLRLVESESGRDHTDAMEGFTKRWWDEHGDIHGMIVKRGSPTCGITAKVYHDGLPGSKAPGRFVAPRTDDPAMPMIDEGHFHAPDLRDHFIERCFARRSWLERDGLQAFHARHKMQLLSHDEPGYRRLGRLAADQDEDAYGPEFFATMAKRPTRGRHLNVLLHLLGFIKDDLTPGDKQRIQATLDAYHAGHVPLLVPVTLLDFLLATHDAPAWARDQTYLRPYPGEWMVRAHV